MGRILLEKAGLSKREGGNFIGERPVLSNVFDRFTIFLYIETL
jgi:hypothetical protein